jgi:hypothetical protein
MGKAPKAASWSISISLPRLGDGLLLRRRSFHDSFSKERVIYNNKKEKKKRIEKEINNKDKKGRQVLPSGGVGLRRLRFLLS